MSFFAHVGILAKQHQQEISVAPMGLFGWGGYMFFTIVSLLWSFALSSS
jgi:hypothetical protein